MNRKLDELLVMLPNDPANCESHPFIRMLGPLPYIEAFAGGAQVLFRQKPDNDVGLYFGCSAFHPAQHEPRILQRIW